MVFESDFEREFSIENRIKNSLEIHTVTLVDRLVSIPDYHVAVPGTHVGTLTHIYSFNADFNALFDADELS